jgi:hypothetical protein
VPSGLIVHTLPSELVQVPGSAAGPEREVVAQEPTSTVKALAKISWKKDGIFMAAILPGTDQGRQAWNKRQLRGMIAKSFATEVQRLPMEQNPAVPLAPRSNWWKRNWTWFVPVGCLSMLVLLGVFVISIALIVFSAMKSTDVYKNALARAQAHPSVIEALGSPIKEGFLVSGNTDVNGASGEANLSIPISGPNGKGTIYVAANKSLGQWNYSGLIVEISKTHQRINLLQSPVPAISR